MLSFCVTTTVNNCFLPNFFMTQFYHIFVYFWEINKKDQLRTSSNKSEVGKGETFLSEVI